MQKWLWGAAGACITAALGTQSWGLGLWLLTGAAVFAFMAIAGPLAYSLNLREGWKRQMLMLGLALAGGTACWVGSSLGYYYYDQEKKQLAAEQKRLEDLRDELSEQRRRADAAVALEGRRLAKCQVVNGRIAGAIESAGTIRYSLETARNAAGMAGTLRAFDQGFDNTEHARAVETWRGTTARMLDEELPAAQLGASLSAIEGDRIGSRSAYALSRLIACMDALRGIQRDLRSHVELAIQ